MRDEETTGEIEQPQEPPPVQEGAESAEEPPEAEASAAARAEEYLQSLVRLKADFDNYRRRTAQDQVRWGESAVAGFIVGLLPVVDNLERALGAAGDAAAVRQGVEMTLRQFGTVLSAAGVTPMAAVGQPFDPARHEAVARGPVPGVAPGAIALEYRKGYVLRDAVLRPAMVKVAAESAAAEAAAAEPGATSPADAAKEGEH